MRQLNFDLKTLQARHREGGFITRRDRSYVFDQAAHMLHALGSPRASEVGAHREPEGLTSRARMALLTGFRSLRSCVQLGMQYEHYREITSRPRLERPRKEAAGPGSDWRRGKSARCPVFATSLALPRPSSTHDGRHFYGDLS